MKNFYGGKFMDGLTKITDVVLIGFYFFITSIPIFTIGDSMTALYYVTHKCIFRGKGYTTEYFKSFKSNFNQATLSWLIFLVVQLVLIADIYIMKDSMSKGVLFAAAPWFFMVVLVLIMVWAIYHFAYIARFQNTFKTSFKVSLAIMFVNIPWTLAILGEMILGLLILYRVPVLVLFAPSLFAIAVHPILEKVFRKYMTPEDLKREEDDDMMNF